MKEYIHKIIIPYVTAKQKYFNQITQHLVIYDEFKGATHSSHILIA